MALSDKVVKAESGEAVATAPAAPAPAPAAGKSVDKGDKANEFKQRGASIRSQMSEDEKSQEGSKSDKVAFVCALGDPNHKQSRVQSNQNIDSYAVVGYKFKILEDTTVPFAPLAQDMKTIVDTEAPTERPVKAGEIVALNLTETAILISRVEYAGKFTGEGLEVNISAKTAKNRKDPLPILIKKGDGSIKENMQLIADMVGADATNKGTPQIKDEFKDSFGALYTKKTMAKKSKGSNTKAGEGQADIAAAFRALYADRYK